MSAKVGYKIPQELREVTLVEMPRHQRSKKRPSTYLAVVH
jgi:hypothetical protein